ITGIIAEYNPFHNGHMMQMKRAREITGADYVIVVMSGDFSQRGAPALMDKYARARQALLGGADLVLELPVCYASGSAEYFATGAISLLTQLGRVNSICFGSECGDVERLSSIADVLYKEGDKYKEALRHGLKSGLNFAAARNAALTETVSVLDTYDSLLASPNNILGIEYIKAIKKLHSPIVPYTNMRIGQDYHSYKLDMPFASALSIREALWETDHLENIRSQVPSFCYDQFEELFHSRFPMYSADFSRLLVYKLLQEYEEGYAKYLDISDDLSDKIKKNVYECRDYISFCDRLKTKDVTFARISRCLNHIMLNITKEDMELYKDHGYTFYARVLGFKEDATPLMKALKRNTSIPIITNPGSQQKRLFPIAKKQFTQDVFASHLYESVIAFKYKGSMQDEYTTQIIKI
ncbi:MAG: nucleotidyltransferase, partial [Lachnospiraceae bacterium]|nr:nucleotidyltransferase [Lachnospiraceae bacterium]